MTADEIVAVATKYGIPVITFLGGALIGHWYAVERDRRKEWNAIAEPLLIILEAEIKSPCPHRNIDREALSKIRRRLGFWKKRRLDKAVAVYQDAKQIDADTLNSGMYKAFGRNSLLSHKYPEPIKKASMKLRRILALR